VLDYHDQGEVFDMRILVAATLLVCCAPAGFAQDQGSESLCNPASATMVDRHGGGVITQKVVLSGKWGSNEATVYRPDKEIADGAVVFSHSEIHPDSGASVDLLPFALTLARAGAAVIVPKRTLIWPPTDQWMNREGGVVICAEHWLIDHTQVFNNGNGMTKPVKDMNVAVREGYGYVGPRLCDPSISSDCQLTGPFNFDDCGFTRYCRTSVAVVPIGETNGGDNTNRVLSTGGLKEAQWLQKRLGLTPIGTLVIQRPVSGS
jgi:hypothetical protein